mmetsp:Transcript_12017/g.28504  ORF Transcript_12017/g.28504 Transcript_12017/m.28504 type:complete len:85 (-) Transcript_12017:181-435(-)
MIGVDGPCVIPSAKQLENKFLSQNRKKRAVKAKIFNFPVAVAVVRDRLSIREDVDGDLDLGGIEIGVNNFPFELQTRVGIRSNR